MKVLCVGGIVYDITFPVDNFIKENKKIKISNMVESTGGSALNVARVLSKWQIDTCFSGIIGDDYLALKIVNELEEASINTKYLEVNPNYKTPISFIINNTSNASRTIITNKSSNISLTKPIIKESFDVLYFDGKEVEFCKKMVLQNPKAIKVIDAGSLTEDTYRLAKLCDYVICSLDFAEDFTNLKFDKNNLDSLCDIYDILKHEFRGKVIITLGEYGSFVEEKGYKLIPSIKVKSIDTTGAGDIFHGAFVYGLINNFDLIKNLKFSNIAGGLSTLKIGTKNSIPRYGDVMEKYNELSNKK